MKVLRKTYKGLISHLNANQIFVFGSNTQGRHGKGSALQAVKWGAIYGSSQGLMGRTYAITTKDLTKPTHPSVMPDYIVPQIRRLYWFAKANKSLEFLIPYSAKSRNLNGYTSEDMAVMFYSACNPDDGIPENIIFEEGFAKLIQDLQQQPNVQTKKGN